MKKFLSNKKYLTVIIFSVVSVLTVALILPQVFALNDGKGELVQSKQEENTIENNIKTAEDIETEAAEAEPSTSEAVKEAPPAAENPNTAEPEIEQPQNDAIDDTAVKTPIAEEAFVKITAESIVMGNLKFNYYNTEENDVVFNRPIKTYMTEKLDRIEVDSQSNKIYQIRLLPENAAANSLKAKSTAEADLKSMADKIATALGADLSRYDSYRFGYEKVLGNHYVHYSKTINGYKTEEYMSVSFDDNLNFCDYYCRPNIFEGFDLSNIVVDGEKIKEKIIQNSKNYYGDNFAECDFRSMLLTVKDSKIVMEVSYVPLDKEGNSLTGNGIPLGYFDIN